MKMLSHVMSKKKIAYKITFHLTSIRRESKSVKKVFLILIKETFSFATAQMILVIYATVQLLKNIFFSINSSCRLSGVKKRRKNFPFKKSFANEEVDHKNETHLSFETSFMSDYREIYTGSFRGVLRIIFSGRCSIFLGVKLYFDWRPN